MKVLSSILWTLWILAVAAGIVCFMLFVTGLGLPIKILICAIIAIAGIAVAVTFKK